MLIRIWTWWIIILILLWVIFTAVMPILLIYQILLLSFNYIWNLGNIRNLSRFWIIICKNAKRIMHHSISTVFSWEKELNVPPSYGMTIPIGIFPSFSCSFTRTAEHRIQNLCCMLKPFIKNVCVCRSYNRKCCSLTNSLWYSPSTMLWLVCPTGLIWTITQKRLCPKH